MKLSEIESALEKINKIIFLDADGKQIPQHFHVTEIGRIQKHFIDCGGTIRKENRINFQLWIADDYDHRLSTNKLKSIIQLSKKQLELEDAEVEVEYQQNTIGKFNISFNGKEFVLENSQTDCLAKTSCGIPQEKRKVGLSELTKNTCSPNSGCC